MTGRKTTGKKPTGRKGAVPKPAARGKAKAPPPDQPTGITFDDLYDDGDIATPKRDLNEEEIKEQEDKRF